MNQSIIIKRSTVAGRKPSNLAAGEIAVNLVDKILYTADTNGNLIPLNEKDYVIWKFNLTRNLDTELVISTTGYKYSDIYNIMSSGRTLMIRLIDEADGTGEERLFVYNFGDSYAAVPSSLIEAMTTGLILGTRACFLTEGDNDSIIATQLTLSGAISIQNDALLYNGNLIALLSDIPVYLLDITIDDLLASTLSSTTILKLTAMRLDSDSAGKLVVLYGGASSDGSTLIPATIKQYGSTFHMYLYYDGKNVHVEADPTSTTWTVTVSDLYVKPSGGIPKTDLVSAVQTSLGKADSAIQTVKVNGTALTPDSNKAVDISIPQSLLLMGTTPSGHTLADDADSYYSSQLGNGEAGAWFITYSDGGTIITPSTEVDASGRIKLSDGWMSRLNYSGATWANVGDILLVYKLNILFTAYKILTLNEAGETRVGLMSPVDKQRVNQVPYKLPYSTNAVYAGGVSDGAYNNVTSGRTNWIDSTALGSMVSLGNLQIAVDPSGRLYSRNKNVNNGNWQIINQLPTIGARDLDTVYDPCVIGYGVCPNGPTSNPSTVYTFASADVDGNGYRSLLLILIDRSTSEPYIRTSFYNPGNSNFTSTNWFKVPNAKDVEDALEFAHRDYSILLESKELSATPDHSDGTTTIDGVTYYYIFLNDCGNQDLIRAININGTSSSNIPRISDAGSRFISVDPTFLYKDIVEYDLGQYSVHFSDTLWICIPESSSDDWIIERRTFVRESSEQQQFRERVDLFMTEIPEHIERDERTAATALTDLNSRINELSEESVFVAEYGVTAYADISAAYDSGKAVFVKDGDFRMSLSNKTANGIFYFCEVSTSNYVWWCYVNPSNGWVHTGYYIEQRDYKKTTITGNESSATYYPTTKAVADYAEAKTNKVTSLSSSSTDVQYPSAKAVWNEVGDINEVLDALNGGDSGAFSNLYKMGVVSQTQTWTQASDGGYDYTMSNIIRGSIPQANIDLFESAGATFNTTTGYFELNGLMDISYNEMRIIYNDTPRTARRLNRLFYRFKGRTNLPFVFTDTDGKIADSVNNLFEDTQFINGLTYSNLEVFNIPYTTVQLVNYIANFRNIASFLYRANYLHELKHPFVITGSISNIAFGNAVSLVDINISQLSSSIAFTNCSRLSIASILYMITNAANTSAITITLHATAYARAIADSDVQAALQAHPTITLASA